MDELPLLLFRGNEMTADWWPEWWSNGPKQVGQEKERKKEQCGDNVDEGSRRGRGGG
jgi:hypothetical protein